MQTRPPSPLQIAANRRNALKSTGPRTLAGKRRVALNRLRRNLCPTELAAELRARGEDPSEFCRMHRDLLALFRPGEAMGAKAVEALARIWWEKARRMRQWVAAGPVRSYDLDARLEELLLFLVNLQRQRSERWQVRLASVLGWPVGSPEDVRRRIEERFFIFGGRPGKRTYPPKSNGRLLAEEFARVVEGVPNRPPPEGDFAYPPRPGS